ncbi:MAG: hypothetical protein JWM68_487 [Verrucomicrobiales bacterium]|nr:hypothetical protein [Verrucomicrobiales bacterium]
MKKTISILAAAVLGGAVSFFVATDRQIKLDAARLLAEKAAWDKEKAALESALGAAQGKLGQVKTISPRTEIVEVAKKLSAKEIIATLKTIRVTARETKNARQAIQQLENLVELGPDALPEIQAFLTTQEEIDYDPSIFGSWKVSKDGNVPTDFIFPPSLRFGLFDVVRQIGSVQAETILSDTLRVTGRGVELAYLTRVLHQIAPFKYRDLAVGAAKDLLNSPVNTNPASALDKFERNYLFGVLAFYNDASLAQQAQAQLVQSDGKVDKGALQYLQSTLGAEVIPAIAQIYEDSRLTNGAQKEPLARLALTFAGQNAQADALWRTAINDKSIPTDARRELVEDLNQDGLNEKAPTERDYAIMRKRLDLIEKNRSDADSKPIADAFTEAAKDLNEMLAKAPKPQ